MYTRYTPVNKPASSYTGKERKSLIEAIRSDKEFFQLLTTPVKTLLESPSNKDQNDALTAVYRLEDKIWHRSNGRKIPGGNNAAIDDFIAQNAITQKPAESAKGLPDPNVAENRKRADEILASPAAAKLSSSVLHKLRSAVPSEVARGLASYDVQDVASAVDLFPELFRLFEELDQSIGTTSPFRGEIDRLMEEFEQHGDKYSSRQTMQLLDKVRKLSDKVRAVETANAVLDNERQRMLDKVSVVLESFDGWVKQALTTPVPADCSSNGRVGVQKALTIAAARLARYEADATVSHIRPTSGKSGPKAEQLRRKKERADRDRAFTQANKGQNQAAAKHGPGKAKKQGAKAS